MSDQPSSSLVPQIACHMFLSGCGFAGALVFLQMAGPGFELFMIFAALFALGGLVRLLKGLIGIIRLIKARRKWARYEEQGQAPKADRMASPSDLKRKGLTKW